MSLKGISTDFRFFKNAKISLKLTIIYAFMFSLVLLLLSASIMYGVRYYLYNQGSRQVQDVKVQILNKITSPIEHVDLTSDELTEDIPPEEDIHTLLVQENGKVLNLSDDFEVKIKIQEPFDRIVKLEEGEKHLLYKNVKIADKRYGIMYLQIIKDMENEYSFMKILFILMTIGDFIGVLVSILLGYMLSKNMLKPIDNITRAAENISINNLKERIELKGPEDELKRLGNTFNGMIDRLQESFNRQIQFVSDASHELRTPIAVIQGYANLLDRWGKDDREALEKSIYAIKLETASMANFVEKLLFLAKSDSGTQTLEMKEFRLNDLIDEVVYESRLIAENRVITNDKNDAVKVFADYKMIKQALRILIDNSIKFTPEQGEIDVSSEIQGSHVLISVRDNGIGIPKNEADRIFDRFYIVDKSRSKDKGGIGLGLSIAKWIVNMHKGTIEVESEEGKGTRMTVSLNLKE